MILAPLAGDSRHDGRCAATAGRRRSRCSTSTSSPGAAGPVWPWVLVLLLVLAAALTGWFVFQQVRDQLAESGTVAVPFLVDLGRAASALRWCSMQGSSRT